MLHGLFFGLGCGGCLNIVAYNYCALRRAAPQQTFINDGDYMTDEKTQQPLGVASDLNRELEAL